MPVSRGTCARLPVFADSPEVTEDGLLHLHYLNRLKYIYLRGLAAASITDRALDSLYPGKCPKANTGHDVIRLGDVDGRPQGLNVTAEAIVRSGHTCISVNSIESFRVNRFIFPQKVIELIEFIFHET